MSAIYLLLLAAIVAILAVIALRSSRSATGHFVITPVSLATLTLILYIVVPSIWVIDAYSGPVLLPIAAALGFTVGVLTVARGNWTRHPQLARPGNTAADKYLLLIPLLIVSLLAASWIRYSGWPPLLDVLANFASNELQSDAFSSQSRFELTKAGWFSGSSGEIATAMTPIVRIGWPFLASLALACVMAGRATGMRLWLFRSYLTISLLGLFVFVAGDFVRGKVLWAGLTVFCAYSLLRPLRGRALLWGGVVALIGMLSLTAFSSKSAGITNLEGLVRVVGDRLDDNYLGDVVVYEGVQSGTLKLGLGRESATQLVSVIPGVRLGIPLESRVYYLSTRDDKGTTYATGTSISILYVDWGLVGVLFGFVLFGALAAGVQVRTQRLRSPPPEAVALAAGATVAVGQLPLSGFVGLAVGLLINVGLFGLFFVAARLMSRPGEISSRSARSNSRQVRTRA